MFEENGAFQSFFETESYIQEKILTRREVNEIKRSAYKTNNDKENSTVEFEDIMDVEWK